MRSTCGSAPVASISTNSTAPPDGRGSVLPLAQLQTELSIGRLK
jgi:hypothetical protein